jgi:hypothetical protein
MKKGLLLIVAGLLAVAAVQAQKAQDVKGINYVNAGVGLGTYGFYGTGGLPIIASFEHGFTKDISAGINFGFVSRKYYTDWKYTYIIFGVRGSYHFNELLNVDNDKVDLYGGAAINYEHYKLKYNGDIDEAYYKVSGGEVDVQLHVGARYLFTDHVGAFAELGYGISPLQLGLHLKF